MIPVHHELFLQKITSSDQEQLFNLMMKIYRPVYQRLWFDDGSGYVNSQFNLENLKIELSESGAFYYFVYYKEECIGIFRYIQNQETSVIKEPDTIKLHRIYLDPIVHSKGIGKALMNWLIEYSKNQKQQSIWLECMDTQLPAYNFYKQLGFKTIDTYRLDIPTMRSEMRGMFVMKLDLNTATDILNIK